MAHATTPATALILTPEEHAELERRLSNAEQATMNSLPAPVVDLFVWLRRKLDPSAQASVELTSEDLAELDAAAADAEDDLRHGRCITADQYFAGVRHPG